LSPSRSSSVISLNGSVSSVRSFLFAVVAGVVLSVVSANEAQGKPAVNAKRSATDRAFCDSEFKRIIAGDLFASSPEKVAAWRSLSARCDGSGLYEARLVGLMNYNGQVAEARKLGLDALKRELDSKRELLVAMAELESRAHNNGLAIDYSKRAIAEDGKWYGGYASLGETHLAMRQLNEAIAAFQSALEREPVPRLNSLLCIAYWHNHQYLESARAMQTALKQDMNEFGHTKAIAAAASSLAMIGQLPAAQDMLQQHVDAIPAAAKDPDFLRAVKIVGDAMKTAGGKASAPTR
jgi:tetratricopeptide (TPR) repeat protein